MSDVMLAVLAASFSSVGALFLQMYVAKTNRRLTFDEKRLDALLQVRQLVETSGGSWFGWADWTLGNRSPVECEKQKTLADEALNKAWYATRVYEMYFPTMKPAADAMRLELSRCKNEAERQISGGGSFDGSRFSEKYHVVDLDVVVDKSRKILGFPSE